LLECRLYIFFDMKNREILLLNIGTKQRQKEDINKIVKLLEYYMKENYE